MRASSWLYQYSSQTKFTYGVCPTIPGAQGPQAQAPPQPVTVAPPPVLPPPQPQPLAYEVPTVDYNRAYGIPPHELELGVPYQQPPTHHPLDDGHMAVWAKERPLVKQEPTEVWLIVGFYGRDVERVKLSVHREKEIRRNTYRTVEF